MVFHAATIYFDLTPYTLLRTLNCENNLLTELNVSTNLKLNSLFCGNNLLTELDVQMNTLHELQTLRCQNNLLTELVPLFSYLSFDDGGLQELDCSGNMIVNLDIAGINNLKILRCQDNQLSQLNFYNVKSLTTLECSNNLFTSFDLSGQTALTSFSFNDNSLLKSFILTENSALNNLTCNNNPLLNNVTITQNPHLSDINLCNNPSLISLDMSGVPKLYRLSCENNSLLTLNLSENTNLQYLLCRNNPSIQLDLSANVNLSYLNCSDCQLTELNLSANTELQQLCCENNSLIEIDLSKNTELWYMDCHSNLLTDIDLAKNTELWYMDCHSNSLTDIDLANNTSLFEVRIWNNPLTTEALSHLKERLNSDENLVIAYSENGKLYFEKSYSDYDDNDCRATVTIIGFEFIYEFDNIYIESWKNNDEQYQIYFEFDANADPNYNIMFWLDGTVNKIILSDENDYLWDRDEDGYTYFYYDFFTAPGTTELNITVVFGDHYYDVIYNNLLETENDNDTTYQLGVGLALQNLNKEGFSFLGWYDSEIGGNRIYSIGDTEYDNKELWAHWTENPSYNVKFMDGDDIFFADTVEENTCITTPESNKEGYTFDGWFIDNEYTSFFNFENPITKDTVIYGHWTETKTNSAKYTVTFKDNDNIIYSTEDVEDNNLVIQPKNPAQKEGYTFGGWFEDSSCTIQFNFEQPITENTTIWAKWTPSNSDDNVPPINPPHGNDNAIPKLLMWIGGIGLLLVLLAVTVILLYRHSEKNKVNNKNQP